MLNERYNTSVPQVYEDSLPTMELVMAKQRESTFIYAQVQSHRIEYKEYDVIFAQI